MSETTSRHALPLLQPGQAQKEMWHNEALALADALLHPLVEAVQAAPPTAPVPGQGWLVAAGASGAWAGQADALAVWTGGGWRFCRPTEGMTAWVKAAGVAARYTGSAWELGLLDAARLRIGGVAVVGPREAAIANPSGGSVVDGEARAGLAAVLAALRSHGLIAG